MGQIVQIHVANELNQKQSFINQAPEEFEEYNSSNIIQFVLPNPAHVLKNQQIKSGL